MASIGQISDFFHVSVTKNEHKYILCFYKIATSEEVSLIATNGQSVYKTRCKYELAAIRSNSSKITIDLKDDQCFVRCSEKEEYALVNLQGKQKQEELFNLIVALAEFKCTNTKTSGDSSKKLSSVPASLSLPILSSKKSSDSKKRIKGNSIINPSQKRRKCAEGVKYEEDDD